MNRQRFDREYLLEAIRNSLNRLMRGWVDLIQLHNPGLRVIEDPSVKEAMNEVKNSGLAKQTAPPWARGQRIEWGLAAINMSYEALMFAFNALEQESGGTLN